MDKSNLSALSNPVVTIAGKSGLGAKASTVRKWHDGPSEQAFT